MLAKPLAHVGGQPAWPDPSRMRYEPKWDGFRALIYRDGDDVAIQGRMRAADSAASGRWDLTYAFPEVVELARAIPTSRFVLDGELVIVTGDRMDFNSLGMRLRPRSEAGGWKINSLAEQLPAELVAFDLLAVESTDLMAAPLHARREALARLLSDPTPGIHLTAHTLDEDLAREWFQALPGAGLEGVIVKPADARYTPGKRTMFKAKHSHTADVVAAGWRPYARPGAAGQQVVGSILLGLYDEAGELGLVGAAGAFTAARRAELAELFAGYAATTEHPWADTDGRARGTVSRWSAGRDASWYPLRPELVCEVTYDQFQRDQSPQGLAQPGGAGHGRFRHVAGFVRWRPDRDPRSATYDQLVVPPPLDVHTLFGWQ
jgi:ATP-dependent DNA ligase